jgi:hypothetical protein
VGEGAGPPWRGIDDLARRVGAYCWAEHRVFELTGRWASGAGDPEIRVFFSVASARHAAWSAQWRDRLPVRAGVDLAALVAAPGPGAAEAASLLEGQEDPLLQLAGLVTVLLPGLRLAYGAHLAQASPVSEGPVIAVLGQIGWAGDTEVAQGRALLEDRVAPAAGRAEAEAGARAVGSGGADGGGEAQGAEKVADWCRRIERSLEAASYKSPDAWAS